MECSHITLKFISKCHIVSFIDLNMEEEVTELWSVWFLACNNNYTSVTHDYFTHAGTPYDSDSAACVYSVFFGAGMRFVDFKLSCIASRRANISWAIRSSSTLYIKAVIFKLWDGVAKWWWCGLLLQHSDGSKQEILAPGFRQWVGDGCLYC